MLAAVAFAWFGSASSEAGKLTLVEDGKPVATILLSKVPTRAAQFAAFELQWHIAQITGTELPIVREPQAPGGTRILVGESEATRALGLKNDDFQYQEYLIRFLPDALVLMGRDKDDRAEVKYDLDKDFNAFWSWPDAWDEQATTYAVYDFLERCCQVRWFNPTELGLDCPHTPTLVVKGKDVRRAPGFRARNACVGGNSEGYDAWTGLWPANSDAYKQYEATAYANLHSRFPNNWPYIHAKRATIRLFLSRMRAGGEKCLCSHSLYNYYERFWERSSNPATAKLFVAKRPEMFAKGYEGTPPQMCYTSPELVQQVVQDARDYFDKGGYPNPPGSGLYPGYHWGENYFAVEPMDNTSYCKCERCQKLIGSPKSERQVYSTGTHSNYFFQFVNQVAREVRKTHPNKWIVTLAYSTHACPPTEFRLEPNVAVQYCFASNRLVYARQEYESDLANLNAWAAMKDRPLYLWLYYTFPVEVANNGRWYCFPGYFAHAIGEQFKLFHKLGIRGMFHCGYGQEVEAYLTYKLMDDPTLDVDDVLDEYFTRYYGAAARPMKKLYLAIEETYCNPKNYPPNYNGHQTKLIAWENLGTEKRMAQFTRLVEEAKRLARTETEKKRVALFELATWRYMLAGRAHHAAQKTAAIPAVRSPRLPDANGDLAKVDWTKSAKLSDTWCERGQPTPSARKFSGRIAHDSKFLYLELVDPCETRKLNASPMVFCYDDWEVFVARQRKVPYRQYAVGPTGLTVALSHGEVDGKVNVPIEDYEIKVQNDTTAPDKWVARIALPLAGILPDGIAPGDKFYMNIIRVSGPAITGTGLGIDTWVPYCSVHDLDRLAEVTLEK